MKDLDGLYPHIMPFAPGVPVPVMNMHILNAARQICEECRVWRDEITVTVSADKNPLAPTDTDNSEIHEIEKVYYGDDDYPIEPMSVEDADDHYPGWRTLGDTVVDGFPTAYVQRNDNEITVFPYIDGDVTISLFVKPLSTATQLPDVFIDQYYEWVADGALARILMLPQQPWTDPNMAAVHQTKFREKLDDMSDHNIAGQINAPVRTKSSFF